MIGIKDIQGNILLSVPITPSCQKVEELMVNDYIQLSWNSDSSETLPIGSYIEHEGERYSLLEPYAPSQKNEAEFVYTPQFKSRVMAWGKKPFFFYSGESKEPDWALTSNPADFMRCICDAIKEETGEDWSYSIDVSLTASASLSFSSADILSGLNQIADAFETEWYADKSTNTIYLGLLSHGDEVTLEVGENINVPSVQGSKEGFYTRFYAFGSTRNIAQDYEGSNTNNLVNKRLTLDPVKYPNGYKDIKEGLTDGEIFSKVLIFDDVYPSAELNISGVRNRLMYRLDSDGKKIQIGTDESGNPIYDQYAIWYFRIEGFDFDLSNIIDGYKLSVSFQSGSLQGREFELKYYDKNTTITSSDGIAFEAKAGDYEILFIEEGSYIIPSMTSLVPNDGDSIVLFNIKMPSEYTQSAYNKLEAELDKEMSRINSDLNNYTFKSNPVAFNENNPNLSIGRNVRYVNGAYSYNTRVIKLVTHIDFPIEQEITIGNEKVKGNTQQLKEEVALANKDLNLLAVFNDMTQSLQQSYNRTQQMMLDGFAAIKNIWQLKTDSNGNTYAFSAFDVVTQKGITMYANGGNLNLPSIYAGLPIDGRTLIRDENGVLMINPDIDLGGASTWGELIGKPSWIGSTKPTYNYSEISQTPDLSVYALAKDLEKYVTLNTEQTIAAHKNFLNGLSVGGLGITKSQDDVIYLDANLVVRGGITMYAEGTVDVPSILDSLPIASTTSKGIASFDSSYFNVDSDGKVTLLAENVGLNETELFDYLSRNNYAKKSDIPSLSGYATETYVEDRIDDLINGAPAAYDTLKEIADVLAGNVNSIGDIITTLGTKANKATTLAGYGITDSYTKSAVDTLLGNYVTLGTAQTITGEKNFTGGLKVNGSPIVYDATNKYWKLEGDLLVTGGVTMYANEGTYTPSTIMDALLLDSATLGINDEGRLYVKGGTGGGVADSVAWENVTGKPSFATVATSGKYSDLSGKPTLLSSFTDDVVAGKYLPLSGGELKSTTVPLYINRESNNVSSIGYKVQGVIVGILGFDQLGNLTTRPNYQTNTNYYNVWHEGNLTPSNYLLASAYTASDVLTKLKTVDGSGSGLDADLLDGLQPSALSVLSASKLTNARTIWGQSFNGTANIDGDFYMKNNTSILFKDANGSNMIGMYASTSGNLIIGLGFAQAGNSTYIDGNTVRLRYGTNNTLGLILNGIGNVGIGTDSPSYKLHVNGNGYFSSTVYFGNSTSYYLGSAGNVVCKNLTASGTASITDSLTVNGKIKLSGTDATTALLEFSRSGYNYITFPNTLSIGTSTAAADRLLVLNSTDATFQCNILPNASNTYNLGGYGIYFKQVHANAYYSGAAGNGLWLIGGNSADTTGVVIGRNSSATTTGAEICRFNANGMVWASTEHAYIRTDASKNIYMVKGDSSNAVMLTSGSFKPLTSATDLLSLGSYNSRWNGVYLLHGSSTNNSSGINFCNTSGNGMSRISSGSNLGIYSCGDILIRGGCTSDAESNITVSTTGLRVYASGDVLVTGGITMYSDIRKKTKLQDVELSLSQVANAPLIEHYYNSDDKRTTHVGSIAQYWAELNNWFCKLDNEGFYTMEIQNAALASAISIARELVKYESKTDKEIRLLKDEVERLKKEIKILKSA